MADPSEHPGLMDETEDNEEDSDYLPAQSSHRVEFHEEEDDDDDDDEDEDDDEFEEEDDEDDEFHDAHDGYLEVEIEPGGGAEDDAAYDADRNRLFRLILSRHNLSRVFMHHGDDDDDGYYGGRYSSRRRRRPPPDPNRFPKVPSDEGAALMASGNFGSNEMQATSKLSPKKRVARRILEREVGTATGGRHRANQRLMVQNMIPSTMADTVIHYSSPVYSGQFSDDGNFFFACVKDLKVRMYDTSNPYKWRYYKTVDFPFGSWTLTDASLSPDNRYLAYTSIQSQVCLAPTDPNDEGDPYSLEFNDRGRHGFGGIWSVRFSGDGRELVAGTNSHSICVYDIEARRSVLNIRGHNDDVNAVCFGDATSPHILYSGSDDTTLKVWDRRSMNDSREAGAFVGHTEGLTYIDSKGDGRYILSNGKDQSMKLWDLRMAMSTAQFERIDPMEYSSGFDYRWATYDEDQYEPHPHDNSLVTFRGHSVLRTLIRCHFSPPGSTNSRYVYSGSEDGKVYVYNLDATLAGKIDVYAGTKDSYNQGYHYDPNDNTHWRTCVRDASWHPNAPVMAMSAWNGYNMSAGTVSVHSWNDGAEEDEAEPRMGNSVTENLEPMPSGAHKSDRNVRMMRRLMNIYAPDSDED